MAMLQVRLSWLLFFPAATLIAVFTNAAFAADGAARAPLTESEKSRPKIGLVLSGGGARGIAHIGVLKVLEEMRVPIDYVAATSMGAIVGGLYASGMSPAAMERDITAADWPTLFSDSPARQDLGLRRKEEESRFPFGFTLGYRDGAFRVFKGALSGSNLELFLHELTRQTDNIRSFDQLPRPFRAVATDMVTGKEIVFDRGLLYKAMRASMSVPGMFAPIEIDGRILGDGGLVNNLPVDVVKAMGADIVIAVNIGTPLMSREQLSSVFGLASQMLNILTEQNVRERLKLLDAHDVLIQPDLGELTFTDFPKGRDFIARGERSARAMSAELAALSISPESYAADRAQKAPKADKGPEAIDFVRLEHTEYSNPTVLAQQMDTQPGEALDIGKLHKDISRLYGRGDFERIDYRLVEEGGKRGLVLDVDEKSWGPNYFRFGLALETDLKGESGFNVIVGHRRTWINSLGAEWVNEMEFGQTRRVSTEFYQPLNTGNWLFVAPYGSVQREPIDLFVGSRRVAEYDVLTHQGGLDFGTPIGSYAEIRAGYQRSHYRADPLIAISGFESGRVDEGGLRLLARYDRLDDPYFPRDGVRALFEAFRGAPILGSDRDFTRLTLVAMAPFALGPDATLNAGVRLGGSTNTAINFATGFKLGGFVNLSGLRNNELTGAYLALGRVVYTYRLGQLPVIGRNFYAGASLEAGNVWATRSDVEFASLKTAGSLFFAADTYFGPFYVAYGRTSGGQSSFYLFLGRP